MSLDRTRVLEGIAHVGVGRGRAENEQVSPAERLRGFLPAPPFLQALDPLVLLIVGGRGAGKSELFEVLSGEGGVDVLLRADRQATAVPTPLLVMTSLKDYPDPAELARQIQGADEVRLRSFWYGLLARRLLAARQPLDLPDLPVLADASARVGAWLPAVEQALPRVLTALDALDARLRVDRRWLFACYDDLDRIVPTYAGLFAPLRQLLGLWLDRWRRWAQIRPKILLRNDIFDARLLAFPDASKLFSNHKVELLWQPAWLYRMWVKRLVNEGPVLESYVRQVVGDRLEIQESPGLGLVPDNQPEAFRLLIETMVGRYMGSNPRKGGSYEWVTNHLQDTKGRATPRSFIQLMSFAAKRALDHPGRAYDDARRILKPSDFHHALSNASNDRLAELFEEDAWLERLRPTLDGGEVPMTEDLFVEMVQHVRWSDDAGGQPPHSEPRELVDYLIRRGVLERRTDGRLNVPDIYLHGFGLKRRGGIRREEDEDDE
jgi:hypothetical protein